MIKKFIFEREIYKPLKILIFLSIRGMEGAFPECSPAIHDHRALKHLLLIKYWTTKRHMQQIHYRLNPLSTKRRVSSVKRDNHPPPATVSRNPGTYNWRLSVDK